MRRKNELDVLSATLLLAALIHFVVLFAYATFVDAKDSRHGFFDQRDVKMAETDVKVVEMRPAPAATPAPTPVAEPVRTRAVPVRAPVLASNHGTGPPVATGHPNGTTGRGEPRAVPRHEPNRPAGGTGGGETTMSELDYNNYDRMPPDIRPKAHPSMEVESRAARARDWKQLSEVLGMDYARVYSAAHMGPYFLSQDNPELRGQDRLNGKQGNVTIIATIDANGVPNPQIVTTGDPVLDRVAYYIAKHTRWLPAVENGRPVACKIQYQLRFRTYRP